MKKKYYTIACLGILTGALQASTVFTNNFQLYKPGSGNTITAELDGLSAFDSYAGSVGSNLTLGGPTGTATYGDLTTGSTVDNNEWVFSNGTGTNSGNYGKNGVGGSTGFNAFASWGGDVRIETANVIGVILAGQNYTLSSMVDGSSGGPIDGPLALWLMADGVQIMPDSFVDITTPDADGSFQQISRTFTASSLTGHVGKSLKIIVGVENANDLDGRVIFDDVLLESTPVGIPEPSSTLLLGLGGLSLILRRRK